jgi:hypothetical protein
VTRRGRSTLLALATGCGAALADDAPIAASPLPLATTRVAASADECAVWRREQSFARSVERHDPGAFAEHLHDGAIFNAGDAEADRGRDAVVRSWDAIVAGKTIALRWRPGIVQIGGDPAIAVSRGPYILQRTQAGADVVRVGFYQTVWLRDARDGVWRVLFDGSASTPRAMESRAAAERWVGEQAMSDCAS